MLDEIARRQGEIILFIDELHTIVGAGAAEGAMDAVQHAQAGAGARRDAVRSARRRSTSTARTSRRTPALERRFQPVFVDEPTVEDTMAILSGLRTRYEAHHGVRSATRRWRPPASCRTATSPTGTCPDKAIDLMDEAASRLRMEIESQPLELDEAERRVRQLEIELAAMAKEDSATRDPLERELPRPSPHATSSQLAGAGEGMAAAHRRDPAADRRAAHGGRACRASRRASACGGDPLRGAAYAGGGANQ